MNEIQKKIINTQRSFRFLIYKKTYSRFNLIKIVKRNEEIRENVERGERLIKMDVQEQVPDSEDGPQNAKKWVNELGISSHGHPCLWTIDPLHIRQIGHARMKLWYSFVCFYATSDYVIAFGHVLQ